VDCQRVQEKILHPDRLLVYVDSRQPHPADLFDSYRKTRPDIGLFHKHPDLYAKHPLNIQAQEKFRARNKEVNKVWFLTGADF
jgi:hypothetical protein